MPAHFFQRLCRTHGAARRRSSTSLVTLSARDQLGLFAVVNQAEIDLAGIQIHSADLHLHAGAGGVAQAGALAAQLLPHFVELEIFAAQLGDVNHALDVERIELHEQAKAGHGADGAGKLLTQMLAHIAALEPGLNIPRGLVGAALICAAMGTNDFPALDLGGSLGRIDGLGTTRPLGRHRHIHLAGIEVVALVRQNRLDDPVHQQVGITPNRAGEVGICLVAQAKVPRVGRGVQRLLHGAQQHRVDLGRVNAILGGRGNRLILLGLGIIANAQAKTQGTQIGLQGHTLFGRRAFVNAEERAVLGISNEVRGADIGRQHGLFDQLVRIVTCARDDLLDAAVVVADDLRLGRVEVNRTTAATLSQQSAIDLVQMQQMRHQIAPLGSLRPMGIAQNRRHLVVGETGVRADHRRIELVSLHLAAFADQHVADHRKPVFIGVERAQAVGQLLRQHRNDAAREVDRGGALVGIPVQRVTGLDVVAHIRNRHQQAPATEGSLAAALLVGLAEHRIIEVTRVFTVNGDQGHIAQVNTPLQVDGTQFLRQLGGLRQGLGAEAVRHIVFAHRDFDLHAGVVNLTQDLHHAAHRLRIQRRRLNQFNRHHLPGRCIGRAVLGDQDVLTHALVFGRHQPDA